MRLRSAGELRCFRISNSHFRISNSHFRISNSHKDFIDGCLLVLPLSHFRHPRYFVVRQHLLPGAQSSCSVADEGLERWLTAHDGGS
jgi:hypothetical protein